jgi:hypothetical protein
MGELRRAEIDTDASAPAGGGPGARAAPDESAIADGACASVEPDASALADTSAVPGRDVE